MADGKRSLKRPAPYSVDQRVVGCSSEVSLEGSKVADFRGLFHALLTHQGYSKGNLVKATASQVTAQWLRRTGLRNPVIVRGTETSADDLGLEYPFSKLQSVEDIASALGENLEVETWDVATQTLGPVLSLRQWTWYWKARQALNKGRVVSVIVNERGKKNKAIAVEFEDEADSSDVRKIPAFQGADDHGAVDVSNDLRYRVLSVPYLPVSETILEADIQPPSAFRECDLTELVWPAGIVGKPSRQIFVQMVPRGSYKDFKLAPGGASVWFHIITGRKVVALAPPSPQNVAQYAAWVKATKNSAVFLGSFLKNLTKVEVRSGDTLLIPGGWLYAVATVEDSVGLQGRFLHLQNLSLQTELACLDPHFEVQGSEEYPGFKHTMWYTALHLLSRLKSAASDLAQRGDTGATNSCQTEQDKTSISDEVVSGSTKPASDDAGRIQVKLKLPKREAEFHPPPARAHHPSLSGMFSENSKPVGNGIRNTATDDFRRPRAFPTSSRDGATSGLKIKLALPKDSRPSEASDLEDISSGEKQQRLKDRRSTEPPSFNLKLKLPLPRSPTGAVKPPRPTPAACAQQEHIANENGTLKNVKIKLKGKLLTATQPRGSNGHLPPGIPQFDGAGDDCCSGMEEGGSGVSDAVGVLRSPPDRKLIITRSRSPMESNDARSSGEADSRDVVGDVREQQDDTSRRIDSVNAAELGSVERPGCLPGSNQGDGASCLKDYDIAHEFANGRTMPAAPALLDDDLTCTGASDQEDDAAEGVLSNWEVEGLPFLLQMLKGWLREPPGRGGASASIQNPKGLVRELELYMRLLELPTTPERNILSVQQLLPDTLLSLEQSLQTGHDELEAMEEAGESCLEVSTKDTGNKGKRKADDAVDSYRRIKKLSVRDRLKKKLKIKI